jgi:hypothetical protein
MTLAAPFAGAPAEALRLKQRFASLDWTGRAGAALVTEYDRDRRWRTTSLVDLASPSSRKTLFDLSANDAYGDPGEPVMETRPSGERVALQDGDSIYLAGDGASEAGDRPFLDRFSLVTLKQERLFRCAGDRSERFLAFTRPSRAQALVRS